MEMHQARYFLALYDHLSFTRAAAACNVTQPALTRAIQALEAELGGPLFRREGRNTHATELGRTMRPYLQRMVEEAASAVARAREVAAAGRGRLTLGLMCSLGPLNVIELLAAFQAAHPEVELVLRDGSAAMLAEMLDREEIDLAIMADPRGIDARFHAVDLFAERFVITLYPDHRLAARDVVEAAELDGERYLGRLHCEYAAHARELFAQHGARLSVVHRSERDDWILAMVAAGLGLSFTPEFAAAAPGVVARRLIQPEIVRQVQLVTMRGRPHAAPVGAFLHAARRHPWPRAEATTGA